MVDFGALFPIGSTGFDDHNPLQPVADKSATDKHWWQFDLPKLPTLGDIPGVSTISGVGQFFENLTKLDTWERVGIILIGVLIFGIGLYMLAKAPVVNIASKVKGGM